MENEGQLYTEKKRHRDAETLRHRGTEIERRTYTERQRHGDTEAQRYRG